MIKITNQVTEQDINTIASLYADYYSNSVLQEKWTKESAVQLFKYFYNQNKDLFFVAYAERERENKPVGIITSVLKPWWDGYHLEDGEIFVIPDYRNQGIAKLLFKALFECAIKKYNATTLEAHTYEDENGFPYNWYTRIGFETVNDLKIISGDIKKIMKNL